MWPSLDNPGMAKLLGKPRILGQGGGVCVWPSLDNPGMAKLLGNPGILRRGGYVCGHPWTIPGWLSYLGILGYLDRGGMCVAIPGQSRDTWTGEGGYVCGHPWTIPGWLCYLGTWEIPSHVSASLDMSDNLYCQVLP